MPLFQKSVLNKYLQTLDPAEVDKAFQNFKSFYGDEERIENIKLLKEENYQEGFLREIFVDVLGYTINPDKNYNLTTEFKNETDSKKADGAILLEGKAIGVIELKSTKTTDMESIIDQAFNYKNHQTGCKYVITSNFEKLRFYIDNATEYVEFYLFDMDLERFKIFYLLLNSGKLLNGIPAKIKKESQLHEENISDKLYKDYSEFKYKIYRNLVKNNPQYDKLILFKKSQKLLDRILFILFAEDSGLVPPNAISEIIKQYKTFIELDEKKTLYSRFVKFFHHLNVGHKYNKFEVPAYNGGLFKEDEILNNVEIDDEILLEDALKLSSYDFSTEVDVNILGHIFEHSINEIEEITAEIEGEERDASKSKRKKEGVFYTPKYITKYIVENTIGELCSAKKIELKLNEIDEEILENSKTAKGKLTRKAETLFKNLETYREYILSLKILDPACGSGAFLNQALDFLIEEHKWIDEQRSRLLKESFTIVEYEKDILEHNLYGVDINEEAVEIAKLSLWLRTAKKGRKLSDLSSNIKCGNSLIDDPEVAGNKAFNWNKEFPEIMSSGGFDVVIGNPPYGRYNNLSKSTKEYLIHNEFYGRTSDLSEFFIRKVLKHLLNEDSIFSFIVPKGITYVKTWGDLRKQIFSKYKLRSVIDTSRSFDEVLYEMVIINIAKKKANRLVKTGFITNNFVKEVFIDEKFFSFNNFYVGLSAEYFKVLESIKNSCLPVAKFYQFWYGKGGLTPKVNLLKKGIPVLTGKEIKRYGFNNIEQKWYINEKHLNETDKERIKIRKVVVQDIVAHITKPKPHIKITASIDKKHNFCFNTVMCFAEKTKEYSNEFLLGILNSSFISFYYYYFVFNQAIRTMHFMPGYSDILPIPKEVMPHKNQIEKKVKSIIGITMEADLLESQFISRLISNFTIDKPSKKLTEFYKHDFKTFLDELKKKKVTLTLKQQDEWEEYFNEHKEKIIELQTQITQTDREIDQLVYQLYGLTEEEIKIVEESTK